MNELFDESKFKTKKSLLRFLYKKQDTLIEMKKASFKKADSIPFYSCGLIKNASKSFKANEPIINPGNELNVEAIINTTNWLDSHMDVHLPGLWKKSLQENRRIKHLQEHRMAFDHIIADKNDLKVSTKKIPWSEFGVSIDGNTEALVFDSIVKASRNPFMFSQYAQGHVDNHSVGMQYVKLILCIDDEDSGANFEAWEKYYSDIVNPEMADKRGYFWAVTEAKVIEGSAVPIGSNTMTPTRNNNKSEPVPSTQKTIEPDNSTRINYDYLINNL